jgi:hypothetical protein
MKHDVAKNVIGSFFKLTVFYRATHRTPCIVVVVNSCKLSRGLAGSWMHDLLHRLFSNKNICIITLGDSTVCIAFHELAILCAVRGLAHFCSDDPYVSPKGSHARHRAPKIWKLGLAWGQKWKARQGKKVRIGNEKKIR